VTWKLLGEKIGIKPPSKRAARRLTKKTRREILHNDDGVTLQWRLLELRTVLTIVAMVPPASSRSRCPGRSQCDLSVSVARHAYSVVWMCGARARTGPVLDSILQRSLAAFPSRWIPHCVSVSESLSVCLPDMKGDGLRDNRLRSTTFPRHIDVGQVMFENPLRGDEKIAELGRQWDGDECNICVMCPL